MRALTCVFALAALISQVSVADAHQEDTSYSQITLAPDHVQTVATFDLHVLQRIVTVDTNDDGVVTDEELAAAAPALQAYLGDRIGLSLDNGPPDLGQPKPVRWRDDITRAEWADWPKTLVDFPFERSLENHPDLLTLSYTPWLELGGAHANLTRIVQFGYPEIEVVFTAEEPDFDYFTEKPTSRWDTFSRFVRLGAEHIWAGLDHILFLVALLVVSRLRELLQIVTAFTVAHSITLALAVFDVVEIPSRWIEAGIAATIVWVAYQNLRGRSGAHRWRLTFAFGLVHGFGFAGVLRDLELPAEGLVRSLAAFNVGVELGQVAIVGALFPVIALLRRTPLGAGAIAGVSAAVGLAGVMWFVERVAGS